MAIAYPGLITMAANRYGTQCVVVSIDFRTNSSGQSMVAINHAQTITNRAVADWAIEAVSYGAGEILLCDADRDGSCSGLNCEVGSAVAAAVPVPVILSGGCGLADHFVRGFVDGHADGVAAGTYFCFRDQNPMQTRSHIRNAGISIRMET